MTNISWEALKNINYEIVYCSLNKRSHFYDDDEIVYFSSCHDCMWLTCGDAYKLVFYLQKIEPFHKGIDCNCKMCYDILKGKYINCDIHELPSKYKSLIQSI